MMSHNNTTTIGEALLRSRRKHVLTLVSVANASYVAISTISAVERGRRIPSLSIVDSITRGLSESVGTFDLPYLASANEIPQREAVYRRLTTTTGSSLLAIQTVLLKKAGPLHLAPSSRHAWHLRLLLGDVLTRRKLWRRAVLVLKRSLNVVEHPDPDFKSRSLSLLGKCYLYLNDPERSLSLLIQATTLSQSGDDWEAALVNLGLAWWALGQYEKARTQWLVAVERVKDDRRRANALMGLGNVALRASQLEIAIQHYRRAHELYEATGSLCDIRARVVNNLLVAATRNHDQETGHRVFETAQQMESEILDVPLKGELFASMAEWVLVQGDTRLGLEFLNRAKELLGATPVLSWFTVRFLELHVRSQKSARYMEILQEIESMIPRLYDPQLVLSIRVRMAILALHRRDVVSAESMLDECVTVLPTMGGLF